LQPPLLALHALKVEPGRAAQVARVGHQGLALQVAANSFSQKAMDSSWSALSSRAPAQTCSGHSTMKVVVSLVELVDVGLKPAVLGLLEQSKVKASYSLFVPSQM
jgi:hypothetical protein